MFTWGENCERGFTAEGGSTADAGVRYLRLSYHIADLSAGRNVLVFLKTNGNAFIIRTHEGRDGTRARGRQKFVKCKEKILAVSCGDDSVTLLSERGGVLCVEAASPLRPLEGLHNISVCQVACGSQHSLALTKDGQVYAWGQDSRGQLGLGRRKPGARSPQHLRSLSGLPLVQVAAGGEQSFALSVSGAVLGWGRNHCGQLGLGDTTDRHTPTPLHCLNMKKIVRVSCGKKHTAALTKGGAVFTFGSGRHGQLGHNSLADELRPRLVAELWGAKVVQVACGRHHTLALTDSQRVYSFGCPRQGQLGRGDEAHPSVPLPVQLPLDGDNDPKIRSVFAGGDCSFATCATNEAHQESNTGSRCLDAMIDQWISEWDSKSCKRIKQEIHRMFSSACCVNQSFLEQRKDKHFQTSPKYHGLNLSQARLAFKKLVIKADMSTEVEDAALVLLRSLNTKPLAAEGLRLHLLLNELLHVIQKHRRRHNAKLTEAVAAAVLRLSPESLQVIGDWWASLSPSTMVKYVKVWKKALSTFLSSDAVPRDSRVTNLLHVLQYMYNANRRMPEPRRMPDGDFCLLINAELLYEELLLWHSRVSDESLILFSFPIVMDLQTKKELFDMNATYCKEASVTPFYWGFVDEFFSIHLNREKILKDTFQQLAAAHHTDFRKPLAVFFNENLTHDHVNVKDFFHKVFREMMSAEAGMFMFNDSESLAWFPSNPELPHQVYFLFGVLCGLALYNQCIIHLPFPLVLFKKLLGVKPSLADMVEFSPCVGSNLKHILENYEDDVIQSLEMDFTIDWDGKKVELDPENPEKPVTGQNKKEFVEAYVNYAFNTSVEAALKEFKRGFFQVCDQKLVKLFRPEELQGLLVGEDFHDWATLKENTRYEGGYHADHPTIKMFWEVFDELTERQKKKFLRFVTGFKKAPILTMKHVTVTVKKAEDDSYDQYYPETHTCFSKLELPLYSSKEVMRTKLTESLSKKRIDRSQTEDVNG